MPLTGTQRACQKSLVLHTKDKPIARNSFMTREQSFSFRIKRRKEKQTASGGNFFQHKIPEQVKRPVPG